MYSKNYAAIVAGETFVENYDIFEIWHSNKKTGITEKFCYVWRYRGRVIDFCESTREIKRCVDVNPHWLENKVREIDFVLDETMMGKHDIEQGKYY